MNHNKCIKEVVRFIPILDEAYDRIIYEYSKYHANPMGYTDCYLYSSAIIGAARKKKTDIDKTLKSYFNNIHPSNQFFIVCSTIDTFITLKLKHLEELGSELDVLYEICRTKCHTASIKFMYHVMIARLQLTLVDKDELRDEHDQAWFAGCLEILKHLKIARKIAVIDNVDMPVQEAFVDMQIHIINMNMVEPSLKKGFSYDAINFLAYHQEITKEGLRKPLEKNASYLLGKYSKEPLSKLITTPYNVDPAAQLSL